jgi:hypothetical protein
MATHEDYLSQEYLYLQKVVEDYDGKALTVKAWSVTFSAAAIGLAYQNGKIAILVVAVISAILFWLVESLVKVNQQAYYARIGEIEDHFAGKSTTHAFQIGSSWAADFHGQGKYKRIFEVMWWPHVFMPHLAIAGLGLLLLVMAPANGPQQPVSAPAPAGPTLLRPTSTQFPGPALAGPSHGQGSQSPR